MTLRRKLGPQELSKDIPLAGELANSTPGQKLCLVHCTTVISIRKYAGRLQNFPLGYLSMGVYPESLLYHSFYILLLALLAVGLLQGSTSQWYSELELSLRC